MFLIKREHWRKAYFMWKILFRISLKRKDCWSLRLWRKVIQSIRWRCLLRKLMESRLKVRGSKMWKKNRGTVFMRLWTDWKFMPGTQGWWTGKESSTHRRKKTELPFMWLLTESMRDTYWLRIRFVKIRENWCAGCERKIWERLCWPEITSVRRKKWRQSWKSTAFMRSWCRKIKCSFWKSFAMTAWKMKNWRL